MPRLDRKRAKPSVITLADRARDRGEWEIAAGHYRDALRRNPNNPPIWVQYGHALKERGRLAEAERAYRIAVAQDPRNADPHLQLGHALKLQGKREEAKAEYLRAVAIDPSLGAASPEFTQLGWSEVHLSELRGMLGAADTETFKMYIDKPEIADGSAKCSIRSGLLIEGWALARFGVASIDIAVDGNYSASAHHGMHRLDVAEAYPGWANAERSGFKLWIPGRVLPTGRHTVDVTLLDNSGNTKKAAFRIDVAEDSAESGWRRKISQLEIDLKDRLLSSLDWHPKFCLLMSVSDRQDEIGRTQATLASFREQAYADWHVFIAVGQNSSKPEAPCGRRVRPLRTILQNGSDSLDLWRDSVLDGFEDLVDRVEILERREARSLARLIGHFGGPVLFGVLAPGDELGRDALLEFAVISGMHRDADFLYSDELRISPASKAFERFLKPQWSPDLLLSTNYIGRLWCVTAELVERTGASLDDVFQLGEYDLVLRATEAANTVRHIPELLCRRGDERLDSEAMERRALEQAMARRGIEGEVFAASVLGTYRLRRRVVTRRLVSIIIPTRASRGLIRTCIETLRDKTAYRNFEIICIDNIPDDRQEEKRWLRANSDKLIEIAEPFNWSRYNNLAVEEAAGEFLLFLNDDTEIIEPDWLDALVEHGQRPEVGVVGPMLLWPDRTVQSAGVFLTNDVGAERHAFRYAAEGDPGYFGLALTQRNVIAINGACFFTRREIFNRLGRFNEAHRVVNNETDYCLKAWREGLLLVFTPYSKIIHHERASRKAEGEDYDADGFAEQWRDVFADGDPFHHPALSKEVDFFMPESEPVRAIHAGRPVLRRDTIRNILVVKLDHIGDCITALPALRRLKEVFPRASLRILSGHWAKPIWSLAEGVDEVIDFDFFYPRSEDGERGATEAELASLRERLAPYRFDIAVDLRKRPETRQVLQHTGARFLVGFDVQWRFPWLDIALEMEPDRERVRKRGHIGESLLNLVNAIDASCEPASEIFRPRPSPAPLLPEPIERQLFSRSVVCLHPAAGGPMKQWSPKYFARLIDLLVERERVNVALIGAADEKGIATLVLQAVHHRWAVVDLVGQLRLSDLPNFMLRCALFVGNDSGPKHLAAGLGVPTVGVHSGVVDPREWGPAGSHAIAVCREMECSPCYLPTLRLCPRSLACLTGLPPGQIYNACRTLLAAGFSERGVRADFAASRSP